MNPLSERLLKLTVGVIMDELFAHLAALIEKTLAKLDENGKQVADLQAQVTSLEAEVASLKAAASTGLSEDKVKELADKLITAVGDVEPSTFTPSGNLPPSE